MSRRTLWIAGIAILALGIVAWDTMFTVHQTRQALVLQFGDPRRAIQEARPALQAALRPERRVFRQAHPSL